MMYDFPLSDTDTHRTKAEAWRRAGRVKAILVSVMGAAEAGRVAKEIAADLHNRGLTITRETVQPVLDAYRAKEAEKEARRTARLATAKQVIERVRVIDPKIHTNAIADVAAMIAHDLEARGAEFGDEEIRDLLDEYRTRSPRLFYSGEVAHEL